MRLSFKPLWPGLTGLFTGVLIMAVCLAAPASLAKAAETNSLKLDIFHQGARPTLLPAGDEPGHVVGMGKRQGQAIGSDGSKAKFENVYTMDAWQGRKTVVWSNVKLTFADGSWIFIQNLTVSTPDQSGKLIGKGKGKIVKGGGRFKGITGTFETTASRVEPGSKHPPGTRAVAALLTYTLP